MSVSIQLHHVARVELGPVTQYPRTEYRGAFVTREITFMDDNGVCATALLFGDTEAALTLRSPAAAEASAPPEPAAVSTPEPEINGCGVVGLPADALEAAGV